MPNFSASSLLAVQWLNMPFAFIWSTRESLVVREDLFMSCCCFFDKISSNPVRILWMCCLAFLGVTMRAFISLGHNVEIIATHTDAPTRTPLPVGPLERERLVDGRRGVDVRLLERARNVIDGNDLSRLVYPWECLGERCHDGCR